LDKKITEQIGIEKIPLGVLKFPLINQMEYIVQKLKERPYSRRGQAITWGPFIDLYHEDQGRSTNNANNLGEAVIFLKLNNFK